MNDTATEGQIIEANNLPDSLASLCSELLIREILKPYEVCQLIKESDISYEDLLPWADFDHPVKDSYGRKMVFEGPNFEVMVMSWVPGDYSAIHDHGYTQWGAVKVVWRG